MLDTALLVVVLLGPILPLFSFSAYLRAKDEVRIYELLLIALATTGTTILTCYFLSYFVGAELSVPSDVSLRDCENYITPTKKAES